jgi:hypothetical protein
MFHLLSWLAVYAAILFAMSRLAGGLRRRRWFKLAFLPGTLLAALVQAVPARLCVSPGFEVSPAAEGRPAFAFKDDARVPCLGGALFLLLSQCVLYLAWSFAAGQLELPGRLDACGLSLPACHFAEVVQGQARVSFRDYFGNLEAVIGAAAVHPLLAACVLYAAVGTLASLRLDGKESLWALVILALFAGAAQLAENFGIGFSFLSRGWWARVYYASRWWNLFSMFVTLAGLSLGALSVIRLIALTAGGDREKAEKRRRPRKAAVRPAASSAR